MPAHNEAESIGQTLESLTRQSLLPKKLVVVNDNSTDETSERISAFVQKYHWIELLNINSSEAHLPGAKVINAFYHGFEALDDNYDVICKFDADIILPANYLAVVAQIFKEDPKVGIAGGIPFILKKNKWVFENIASREHVRGPIKAYRKKCFSDINGLKRAPGWDTVDVLLAKFHGWKVVTDKTLHVKHLKPTGAKYHSDSKYLRGEALYRMRMGFVLAVIASLKSAIKNGSFSYFFNALRGFFKAKSDKLEFLVDQKEGNFIRNLHWKTIFKRFKIS